MALDIAGDKTLYFGPASRRFVHLRRFVLYVYVREKNVLECLHVPLCLSTGTLYISSSRH